MIDRDSSIPMYYQLQNLFIDKMNRGEIEAGCQTPTVDEICKTYKLSRITVIKAFENLKKEGYLYSIQGKGYFVKEQRKIDEQLLGKIAGFTERMKKYDLAASSVVLECTRITPSEKIAKLLNVSEGDKIAYIARVRIGNNEALSIDRVYINDKYCPGITDLDLSDKSIYELLRNKYHLSFKGATRMLEAVIILPDEAKVFSLPSNQPGFLSTSTIFLDNGQPIEHSKQIFRGDRYRFVLESEEHMNSLLQTNVEENLSR
jgi:GntR family transcriptional regulator